MDVGSLTGRIVFEDQTSDGANSALHAADDLEKSYAKTFKSIAEGAGLVAVAITSVVASIGAMAVRGTEVNNISDSLDKISGSADNTKNVLAAMSSGVMGTVDSLTLMKDASKLLSSGAVKNAEDFGTLSRAAYELKERGLGTTTAMMDTLTKSMQTGSASALQAAGVMVDLQQGQRDYAAAIGTTSEKLTSAEKLYANQMTIHQALNDLVRESGEKHRDLGDMVDAASVSVNNFVTELSSQVAKSSDVVKAAEDIGNAIQSAFGSDSEGAIQSITEVVNSFARGISNVIGVIGRITSLISDNREAIIVLTGAWVAWHYVLSADIIVAYAAKLTGLTVAQGLSVISTDAMTFATGLYNLAALTVTATLQKLWAVMMANPITAVVVIIGTLITALALWYENSAKNAMQAEILANKQTVIATAIKHGADATISYADALKYNDEWYRKLEGTALTVEEALTRLHDKSGNTASAIDELNKAVIAASNSHKLSTPIIKDVASELKSLGVKTADLPPALKNIVLANAQLVKASGEAGNAVRDQKEAQKELEAQQKKNKAAAEAHTKAVNDMVTAMTTGSKSSNVTAEAFAKLTQEQLQNGQTLEYLLPKLTKLAQEQGYLTDAQQDAFQAALNYRDAVEEADRIMLANKGATLDVINAQIALGHSTEEIGVTYGVTGKTINEFIKAQTALRTLENGAVVASAETLSNLTTASKSQATESQKQLDLLQKNIDLYQQLSPAHRKEIDLLRTQTNVTEEQINKEEQRLHVLELLGRVENVNNTGLLSALTSIGDKVDVFDTLTLGQQAYVNQTKGAVSITNELASALGKIGGQVGGKYGDMISGVGSMLSSYSQGQAASRQNAIDQNARHAGDAPGTWEQMDTSGSGWGNASVAFDSGASGAARVGAGANMAMGAIQGIQDLQKAYDQRGRGHRAASGALAGAKMGMSIAGPYGAAIGAAAGAIVGAVKGDPAWAKAQDEITRDLGVGVTEELGRKIADDAEKYGGRQQSIVAHLGDVISDAGGLGETNIDAFTKKLHDVFTFMQDGSIDTATATKTIQDNWAQFATAGTSDMGVLKAGLVDVIHLTQEAGIQSKAMTDYLAGQGAEGAQNFGDSLSIGAVAILNQKTLTDQLAQANADYASADSAHKDEALAKINELNSELAIQQGIISATAVTSQGTADALAAGISADFHAMLDSGMTYKDAVEKIAPSIESLQIQMKAAGLTGSAAFDALIGQVNLYADAIAGPALQSVDSLSKGMVNLSNMGVLNQETFSALTDQIGTTYTSLVDQGYNGQDAMLGMRDSIQRVWEEQQEFGYVLTGTTKDLVDQAVAQGIVGEKHKSVADQMLDATNRMADALEGVAHAMGVDVPAAADQAARTTRGATDAMVHDWDRVHDAATGAAEGHSPSGIKQIVVRTAEAQAAVELAAAQMIAAFGQVFLVVTGLGDAVMDTFASVQTTIRDFENAAGAVKLLTDAQKAFIDRATAAGVSLSDIAALLGTTTQAITLYVDAHKKATDAVAAATAAAAAEVQALADINQAITDHHGAAAALAQLSVGQLHFIDTALEAGVSVDALAGVLHTTVDAINLYVAGQEAAAAATQAAADAVAHHVQVIEDINQAIADHAGAADALALLTAGQLHFIDTALDAGVSVDMLAEALGTTVDAIQLYIDTQNAAADASKAAADAAVAAAAATAKAAEDAAAAAAKEAQKITDINTAIADFKGAATEASTFTTDQRGFIRDAIAAGVSVSALADVLDTTTYAIQYYVDSLKSASSTTSQMPPLTGADGFERWRQDYSQSVATPTEYYATGTDAVPQTRGTDTVAAMLTPGEGVLTVEQNKEYHQTIEGPSNQEVVDSINGLRSDMAVKMPRAMARALHTGLVGLRTAS